MFLKRVGLGLLAGLWLCAVGGCQKSSQNETSPNPEKPSARSKAAALPDTIARLHWLGKKRLQGETNAAFFMSIWDLPESSKLEAQTLDKLALALANSLSKATNPASLTNLSVVSDVRPLLDDLLKEECYVEVRSATNQPGELGLAIRLNEDRAGVWETNLAKAFDQLSARSQSPPVQGARGWQVDFEDQNSKTKNHLALARVGTWTVVTLSRPSSGTDMPQPSTLINDLASRIQSNQGPFGTSTTNYWVETDLEPNRLAEALGSDWPLPAGLSKLSLTMIGDGLNVRTRGDLTFSKPLGLEFEPWNIPTNLIHDPLVSFTAINGIRPLLAVLPVWTNLNVGSPPNQVYVWSVEGAAVQTYFSAPFPNASNVVNAISSRLMDACNPWLTSNKIGNLERAANLNGLTWKGFPFLSPFLKSADGMDNRFALGGIGPELPLKSAAPEALIREVTTQTNALYYDWEVTGPRLSAGIYTSQLARFMMRKAQLPANSIGLLWLKALGQILANCGTELTAPDRMHLAIVRKSGLGLSAAELHLFVEWLESPAFPSGLYTPLAPDVIPPNESRQAGSGNH